MHAQRHQRAGVKITVAADQHLLEVGYLLEVSPRRTAAGTYSTPGGLGVGVG